jgi:hypothetical protein
MFVQKLAIHRQTPIASYDMSSTFRDTIKQFNSIQPDQFTTDVERYEAKEAARRLLSRLETPFEQGWRLSFETPVLIAGVQTLLDLGIWQKWNEANKEKPGVAVTLTQLLTWSNTEAEPNLLRKSASILRQMSGISQLIKHTGRFLRHLAALYVLVETDVDTWKSTPYSLSLGDTVSHTDQITQCGYVEDQ